MDFAHFPPGSGLWIQTYYLNTRLLHHCQINLILNPITILQLSSFTSATINKKHPKIKT